MIIFNNFTRSEARAMAKRRKQWKVVDRGANAPQGKRYGVRVA